MRILVYGKPHVNRVLAAFIEGCKALGYTAIQRSAAVFTPDQTEAADMVAVYGWKSNSPVIAAAYQAKGVPCIVMDAGYIHRDREYHAVGFGGLNDIPSSPCPPDRLAMWGELEQVTGSDVLIAGQVAGDAQLPPDFNPYLWAAETAKELKTAFPDRRVIWKPHPKCQWMDCSQADETRRGTLHEALKGCGTLVTYNSTAAYEAMLRGVSVICDPSAVYAPHVADPTPFLQRVAYAQWTAAEIAAGDALRFLNEGPPADASADAEAARRDDEGRKSRTPKKGVKRGTRN